MRGIAEPLPTSSNRFQPVQTDRSGDTVSAQDSVGSTSVGISVGSARGSRWSPLRLLRPHPRSVRIRHAHTLSAPTQKRFGVHREPGSIHPKLFRVHPHDSSAGARNAVASPQRLAPPRPRPGGVRWNPFGCARNVPDAACPDGFRADPNGFCAGGARQVFWGAGPHGPLCGRS